MDGSCYLRQERNVDGWINSKRDNSNSKGHVYYLKNWLRLQGFSNNEELMEGVKIMTELTGIKLLWPRLKKLIPDINASILGVTMLRSSWNMYVLLMNFFFFSPDCLCL
jgi:hypothetical protein